MQRHRKRYQPSPNRSLAAETAAAPVPAAAALAAAAPVVAAASARDPGRAGDDDSRALPPTVMASIDAARGGGSALPNQVRAEMEASFGADFSAVRVHTGPGATALNRMLHAEAFTTGADIFFAGTPDPDAPGGRELLAHELTHVVQQATGANRVARSGGRLSHPTDPAEIEARAVGRAVAATPRRLLLAQPEAVQALGTLAGNTAATRLVCDVQAERARPAGRDDTAQLIQRSPSTDLIDANTSWGNLAEDRLGQTLLARALGGEYDFVQSTLDALGSTDRDDVSYELTKAAVDEHLVTFARTGGGRRLLDRLFDELTAGSVANEEQAQADRIIRVKAQLVDQAQAEQHLLHGKVFPFRLPGLTVLADAPISAERRDGGRVWVKQPVRVLGTDEFRGETATLPTEVFTSGVLLPEHEVVGVKLYDLGGQVVHRPALFLVQIANQHDTAVLMKIAEVAGIALTLGTGALAGLGIEASMAARVLLWADRAAFVLGTVTTVINEHRGEIISRYGDPGRAFLHYVDIVHSATAMYGFARTAIGLAQALNGLRTAYLSWRDAVRSVDRELSDAERQLAQRVQQQTDELLQHADQIATVPANRQLPAGEPTTIPPNRQLPAGEPTTIPPNRQLPAGEPTTIPPERQLGPGRPPTARERLDARRAAQAEQSRVAEIRDGIERVDRELAAGTHRRRLSQDDIDWLNAHPRRKEIAYDPDIGTYRVSEARQALACEEARVIPSPVSRSVQPGTDVLDGAGVAWSLKGVGSNSTVESTVALIAGEALAGRPCIGDLRGMSMREQALVRTALTSELATASHAEIRFLPPGVERIAPR